MNLWNEFLDVYFFIYCLKFISLESILYMVMDAHQVMSIYGIEKDIYWEIIRNYEKYYNEFIG